MPMPMPMPMPMGMPRHMSMYHWYWRWDWCGDRYWWCDVGPSKYHTSSVHRKGPTPHKVARSGSAGLSRRCPLGADVQLDMLLRELLALTHVRDLMLGYMTVGVSPVRPTAYPERAPKTACVSQHKECWPKGGRRVGGQLVPQPKFSQGCFLGDLETKLNVPGFSPVIGWWSTSNKYCGMAGPARSTMAPFPTGPLAVFSVELARAVFSDCGYVQQYMKEVRDIRHIGRRAGRDAMLDTLGPCPYQPWCVVCAIWQMRNYTKAASAFYRG